jgi:acyl-CoA thioesterase-1
MLQSSLNFITQLCLVNLFLMGCGNPDSSKNVRGPETENEVLTETSQVQKKILFFGNSLTAGYGVEPEQAFSYLIQLRLDSIGLPYRVINAGLSGETTASGVNRIDWVLREPVAIMILELGGNDGLRGIDPAETKKNLQQIIGIAQNKYSNIQIIIAGMEAPPNMGSEYITAFRDVFRSLAADNNLRLIPFLLEGVGGEPELNLPDGIHPNPEGHKIVADNVWQVLEELLPENAASD